MNTPPSDTRNSHQQIQLLLPWYVNQTLDKNELKLVESHVRHCLPCRREILALRKLAGAVMQGSEMEVAADTSFAKLTAQLSDRTYKPASPPGGWKSLQHRGRPHLMKLRPFRYAFAASLLLALFPMGQRMISLLREDTIYYTLSAARSDSRAADELRVVFAKNAPKTEIAAVLAQLHGRQEGEANSVGALTIRLSPQKGSPSIAQALAILRSHQHVLLAEPVLQP